MRGNIFHRDVSISVIIPIKLYRWNHLIPFDCSFAYIRRRQMQYDFLKNFPRRMKTAGLSAVLVQNTVQKNSWSRFGFDSADEKINMVYSVLLFVMDQSLKEEPCTLDDVGNFIDGINGRYLKKPLGYDDCKGLADFIMNDILSNGGAQMTFAAYDYENEKSIELPVRYVSNSIVFLQGEVRRSSFALTDDGYNLVLGTLEMESNLRLTVQEIVFRMHLERQHYDKAVDSIKDIFATMRIQLQRIQEAMHRIRRNALEYSVAEYDALMDANLTTIDETKRKFEEYRIMVSERVSELEEKRVELDNLPKEDREKLANLKVINEYLGKTLDEHQRILTTHYALKELYGRELEDITQAMMVKRFSFREGIYDRIMDHPALLGRFGTLLSPMLNRDPPKVYDPLRAASPQVSLKRAKELEITRELDFDPEEFEREQKRIREEKKQQYAGCLRFILQAALQKGKISLKELKALSGEAGRSELIPDIDVFKEVMVELIKAETIDTEALKKERKQFITNEEKIFELNLLLLDLLEESSRGRRIRQVTVRRLDRETVVFENIETGDGRLRTIRCTNVVISCREEQDGI